MAAPVGGYGRTRARSTKIDAAALYPSVLPLSIRKVGVVALHGLTGSQRGIAKQEKKKKRSFRAEKTKNC